MALKELSDGGPDGVRLGQSSTDKVAFYGATPVARLSSASQAAVTAGVPSVTGTILVSTAASGVWGFQTSTALKALGTKLKSVAAASAANKVLANQLRAELVELGLIAGS